MIAVRAPQASTLSLYERQRSLPGRIQPPPSRLRRCARDPGTCGRRGRRCGRRQSAPAPGSDSRPSRSRASRTSGRARASIPCRGTPGRRGLNARCRQASDRARSRIRGPGNRLGGVAGQGLAGRRDVDRDPPPSARAGLGVAGVIVGDHHVDDQLALEPRAGRFHETDQFLDLFSLAASARRDWRAPSRNIACGYDVLYGKVKAFVQDELFERGVELEDPNKKGCSIVVELETRTPCGTCPNCPRRKR